jgi:hypothetical protein
MEVPAYREAYLLAYQDALASIFGISSLQASVSQLAETIGDHARADLLLWDREDVDFDEATTDLLSAVSSRHAILSAAISDALSR